MRPFPVFRDVQKTDEKFDIYGFVENIRHYAVEVCRK